MNSIPAQDPGPVTVPEGEIPTVSAAQQDVQAESVDGPADDTTGEAEELGEGASVEGLPEVDEEDSDEKSDTDSAVEELGQPIKTALQTVLDTSFTFNGTYAVSATYNSAPNPGLTVDGFGMVGFPLSAAEAIRLRAVCNRAPFGKGERTVVDTEVRDTWELDPEHVRFQNMAWAPWVKDTALRTVCIGLGVDVRAALPRCELYKMLLYEAGSHFLPHQDTEKAPGMFATIVIVLPSQFQGGEVHVSHGSQHKVFNTANDSVFSTSVLAWYTDVMHEVKPITRGYRLALSYNLIHAATSTLPPRLPALDLAMQTVERVLRAWRRADHQGADFKGAKPPQKLAYMLEHKYSHANLSFDKLKGRDTSLVHTVREVCNRVGFRIALGSLEYRQRGYADDDGPYHHHRWGYDDSESDRDVGFMEIEENECTVQLISGPNGEHLGEEKEMELDELLVDEDYFAETDPDEKDYEGYQGNGAGSLEYFYHRTVLLMWPRAHNADIVLSFGGQAATLDSLADMTSAKPSREELDMVDVALAMGTAKSGRAVANVAMQWRSAALWIKAARSCRAGSSMDVLGEDHLLEAYAIFGFKVVAETFEQIISNSLSTAARLKAVSSIDNDYPTLGDAKPALKDWFVEKRAQILSTLKKPDLNDVNPIVEIAWTLGGLTPLRDVALPQLAAYNLSPGWWLALIRELQQKESSGEEFRFQGWVEPVFRAIKPVFEQGLLLAPTNVHRFNLIQQVETTIPSSALFGDWCTDRRRWAIQTLTAPSPGDVPLFTRLQEEQQTFVEAILLPKLRTVPFTVDFWASFLAGFFKLAEKSEAALPENWTALVLDALSTPVCDYLLACKTNLERFSALTKLSSQIPEGESTIADFLLQRRKAALDDLMTPTEQEVKTLVQASERDVDYAQSSLLPQLKKLKPSVEFWKSFIRTVQSQAAAFVRPESWTQEQLNTFSNGLVEAAVSHTALTPANAPSQPPRSSFPYYRTPAVAPTPDPVFSTIKDLLTLCIETGNTPSASRVFRTVFAKCNTVATVQYTILPLIVIVRDFLKAHLIAHDTPPFDKFFIRAMIAYAGVILGPKPHPRAREWHGTLSRCTCHDCSEVNQLLTSQTSSITWRALQQKRNHVETHLRSVVGLTLSTLKRGSPHGLVIAKSATAMDITAWKAKSAEGLRLMSTIGCDALLRKIWAKEPGGLPMIVAAMKGEPLSQTPAPPVPSNPSQASTSSGIVQTALLQQPTLATSGAGSSALSLRPGAGPTATTVPQKRKATVTHVDIDLTLDDD